MKNKLMFPVDIGDTVYLPFDHSVSKYKVTSFTWDGVLLWAWLENPEYNEMDRRIYRCLSYDIGRTIFLTEAEANKKAGFEDVESH